MQCFHDGSQNFNPMAIVPELEKGSISCKERNSVSGLRSGSVLSHGLPHRLFDCT